MIMGIMTAYADFFLYLIIDSRCIFYPFGVNGSY